ncbi:MAG: HAMP domain-containing sensor histidine kinase [Isosphaeraceae bacterium]|nr:HAMP domain-containing sensor histidine kinase [Isosphaeraceae bacterium]
MPEKEPADNVEKLTDLGHLSAGVGHHVINAFSAIVSNAELLRLKSPQAPVADPAALAETIIQSALNAATVARRLIDYTRSVTSIEPGRGVFTPASIALDRLVAEFVEEARSEGPEGIAWATDLAAVPRIQGHDRQLKAMLGHLTRNAFEAMPSQQGVIAISTAADARGWVVLELRDSGEGMTHETQERAVEPFFSTRPGHLGVGLSIANGIWRRHRGTLSLRSQPGEGTVVRLCIEPIRA